MPEERTQLEILDEKIEFLQTWMDGRTEPGSSYHKRNTVTTHQIAQLLGGIGKLELQVLPEIQIEREKFKQVMHDLHQAIRHYRKRTGDPTFILRRVVDLLNLLKEFRKSEETKAQIVEGRRYVWNPESQDFIRGCPECR